MTSGKHRTSDYEKIEWLLANHEQWATIAPTDNWWPDEAERAILVAMVPLVRAAGLYAKTTYRKDVVISLYRNIQKAWHIKKRKDTHGN